MEYRLIANKSRYGITKGKSYQIRHFFNSSLEIISTKDIVIENWDFHYNGELLVVCTMLDDNGVGYNCYYKQDFEIDKEFYRKQAIKKLIDDT